MGSCCAHEHTEVPPSANDASELVTDKAKPKDNAGKKSAKIAFDTPDSPDADNGSEEVAPAARKERKIVTKSQHELDKIAAARGRGHREGISAEVISQDSMEHFVKPVHPKSPKDEASLSDTITKNEKMEVIAGTLSGSALTDVVNAFFAKTVKEGEDVIRQGDVGDCLYICEEGQLDIFVARPDPDTGKMPEGKGDKVLTVGAGALFGELALMYSSPRAATVTVASATAKLWALERDAFKMLLVSKGQKQFQVYQGYLTQVEILKPFNNHELSQVADMMESNLFDSGEVVISQGDPGDSFFIVEDGTCSAFIEGPSGEQEVKAYKAGDYFGEIALLTDEPRKATVRGTGRDGCSVLSISKEDFFNVLGPIKETLKSEISKYPKYADYLK